MNEDPYNSVLQSIKKLLGIAPSITDFDPDVMAAINASIFTLKQLGINTKDGCLVYDETTTYQDLFGKDNPDVDIAAIKQYIYCRSRIIFDPPQSSALLQSLQEQARELEWRLRLSAELRECEIEDALSKVTEFPNDTIQNIWDDVMNEGELPEPEEPPIAKRNKQSRQNLRQLISECLARK